MRETRENDAACITLSSEDPEKVRISWSVLICCPRTRCWIMSDEKELWWRAPFRHLLLYIYNIYHSVYIYIYYIYLILMCSIDCAGSSLLCRFFSGCGERGLLWSSRAQASHSAASFVEHGLWNACRRCLVSPQHGGSSRDATCVSCIGRGILNREPPWKPRILYLDCGDHGTVVDMWKLIELRPRQRAD